LAITLSGQYVLKDGNWHFMVAALIYGCKSLIQGLPTVFLFSSKLLCDSSFC